MPTLAEVQSQVDAQTRETVPASELDMLRGPAGVSRDEDGLRIRIQEAPKFDIEEVVEQLKTDELDGHEVGEPFEFYRDGDPDAPHPDGNLTVGWGHLVEGMEEAWSKEFPEYEPKVGTKIPYEIGERLLAEDVNTKVERLEQQIDFFKDLPGTQQAALVNMSFQMGVGGVKKFEDMLSALKKGAWAEAKAAALDSQWARRYRTRANGVASMLGMSPNLRPGKLPTPGRKPQMPDSFRHIEDRQHGKVNIFEDGEFVGSRPIAPPPQPEVLTPIEERVRHSEETKPHIPVTGIVRQGPVPRFDLRRDADLGQISAFDIAPLTGAALAISDVEQLGAREERGLSVGMFEKSATIAAVPLSIVGDLGVMRAVAKLGAKMDRLWAKFAAKFAGASPLGRLPEQRKFKAIRYKTLGKIDRVERLSREINDLFRAASPNDQRMIYDYLTTAPEGSRAFVKRDGTFIEPGPLDIEQIIKETAIGELDDVTLAAKAQTVKRTILEVGKELVNRNIISEAAFNTHAGAYLPRVYLRYLLDKPSFRGIGGKKLSDAAYAKQRKDIPQEVREVILGEITNPGYLAAKAISVPGRDIAITDYLRRIAQNPQWVLPNQMVNYRGKFVTPQFLKQEADRLRRQSSYAETENIATKMKAEADRMDAVANPVMEALDVDYKMYKQIPNTARYGDMRGMWVRKEIHSDLVGAARFAEPDNWAETILGPVAHQAHQIWKLNKTALNPPTQVRNFISNASLMHLSGVALHDVPTRITQAIRAMAKNGEAWQIAKDYGVAKTTFTNAELIRMEKDMIAALKGSRNPIDQAKRLAGIVGNAAGDAYQFSEMLFKTAKIADMRARGFSAEDAALEAHEWLFDYSLVHPTVRTLRQNPFLGSPFLTFNYKVFPRLLETAFKRPTKFLSYAVANIGVREWFKAKHDMSNEEFTKFLNTLPEFLQNSTNTMILPYRDENGQWQAMNVGYYMPWGMYADTVNQLSSMDTSKNLGVADTLAQTGMATAEIVQASGLLGTPITQALTGLNGNRDPFTKKKIYDPRDPPADQMADVLGWLWSLSAPSWLSGTGAVAKTHETLTGKLDKYGNKLPTVTQAMLRFLGLNIYSIDPDESRKINIQRSLRSSHDTRDRVREKLSDQTLTREQMRWYSDRYEAIMRKQIEELREYKRDSAVPPSLRARPE